MDKYIWTKNNFICNELCEDIIDFIKDYKNINLINFNDNKYINCKSILIKDIKIIEYINKQIIETLDIYANKILNTENNDFILDNLYNINKLEKNIGFKKLKHDFIVKQDKVFTYLFFIIFLNNNDEFSILINNIKIKPEIGKILLFPCGWCFPYEYLKSQNDNYFITGYIHKKY